MENEVKEEINSSIPPKKNWKRRRNYPPRKIAISQQKMLLYHWPLPSLFEYGPWRKFLSLLQKEHSLPLFNMKMQQSDQVFYISNALATMKGLKVIMIDFHYNRKINDASLDSLSRRIARHKKLKAFQLNVSCCREVKDKGIISIGNSLRKIQSIQNFYLIAKECDGVTNHGLKQLSKILSHFPLLSLKLDFKNCCMITEESILVISKDISYLKNLNNLDLSFSEYRNSFKVSDNALSLLADSISTLKHLRKLQLDFN